MGVSCNEFGSIHNLQGPHTSLFNYTHGPCMYSQTFADLFIGYFAHRTNIPGHTQRSLVFIRLCQINTSTRDLVILSFARLSSQFPSHGLRLDLACYKPDNRILLTNGSYDPHGRAKNTSLLTEADFPPPCNYTLHALWLSLSNYKRAVYASPYLSPNCT